MPIRFHEDNGQEDKPNMPTIQQNLTHLHQQIREFEIRYHRRPNSVTLLAASKKQPLDKIKEAIDAGQHIFGENHLQDALPNIAAFEKNNLEWHFIGSVQRNKTKKIAELFSWVHGVDDILIAKRLSDQRPKQLPPLNICLEINISHESTKSGIAPENALKLAKECLLLPHLTVRGLMAIPAPKINLTDQRVELRPLKQLYDHLCENGLNLDTLSMGMSHDLEAAIAEGATLVRIGTALFGTRI